MQTVTLNIDSRGQIRLPKQMRSMFQRTVILKVIDKENIMISPMEDIAGSLTKYSKNLKTGTSWEEIRQKAWEESTKGRA